jgi:hypothetical protein
VIEDEPSLNRDGSRIKIALTSRVLAIGLHLDLAARKRDCKCRRMLIVRPGSIRNAAKLKVLNMGRVS